VAGLATDTDLRKARGKAVVGRVVILAHARRMALRAHEIPVLIEPGPVQRVVVLDLLVGIKMKPALPALVFWPGVPGNGQRLQPLVWKFDQILLQRSNAEGVFDLEARELAIRPVGLNEEFSVVTEEARANTVVIEARAIEITQH